MLIIGNLKHLRCQHEYGERKENKLRQAKQKQNKILSLIRLRLTKQERVHYCEFLNCEAFIHVAVVSLLVCN